MAEVYEKGIYPISQDGNKAIEWYQRALEHAYHNENRIRVYRSTFHSLSLDRVLAGPSFVITTFVQLYFFVSIH